MSGFAALMALSASQTKESQSAVQTALLERQRNQELRRKKQEDAERKAREEEAKLRQKRFEDERKEREREARRAADEARLLAEQTRREEEARAALLYGPKKARHGQTQGGGGGGGPRWPTSSRGPGSGLARDRFLDEEDEDAAVALTREEKRQRRMELEMRRTYQLKRSSAKPGRRLPGGAIDTPSSSSGAGGAASDPNGSAQSVKARLAALPNTLTRLNVNKRDTRTIDEILQDRARAKNATLDGEEARGFNDWFGTGKKKEPSSSSQSSGTLVASAPSSGANSPGPAGAKVTPVKAVGGKPTKSLHASKPTSAKPALKPTQTKTHVHAHAHASKSTLARSAGPPKKRPRSGSLSSASSSPPPKRRPEPESVLGSEIWKMFGKDRSSYVGRDVLSDDEDMEADADAVMKEEMRSARLAKREDEMALEEEKRHEEEKRRRKREREMRERQGM